MTAAPMVFVYITAPDAETAKRLGASLVGARLAACVNILAPMTSIYHWDGRIEEAREAVLIAKTRSALVADLTARVKAEHPYTVPCVVALPVLPDLGNPDYARWLADETAEP